MKPTLIIIDGQNGAGKSTVAKLLHKKLPNTALIHWDVIKNSFLTLLQEHITTKLPPKLPLP